MHISSATREGKLRFTRIKSQIIRECPPLPKCIAVFNVEYHTHQSVIAFLGIVLKMDPKLLKVHIEKQDAYSRETRKHFVRR